MFTFVALFVETSTLYCELCDSADVKVQKQANEVVSTALNSVTVLQSATVWWRPGLWHWNACRLLRRLQVLSWQNALLRGLTLPVNAKSLAPWWNILIAILGGSLPSPCWRCSEISASWCPWCIRSARGSVRGGFEHAIATEHHVTQVALQLTVTQGSLTP